MLMIFLLYDLRVGIGLGVEGIIRGGRLGPKQA